MKKLFSLIYILLLFSFSYGASEYSAWIEEVNSIGTFIGDRNQSVEYDFDIYIEPRDNGEIMKEAYFIPDNFINGKNINMTLDKLDVIDGREIKNIFKFPIDNDGKVDILKIKVRGKIILNTSLDELKGSERIKIGDVQEKVHKRGVYLIFDYSILKKEKDISLRVIRDMDLGVAVAGETLRTTAPAKIRISGIDNQKIEVEIDTCTKIYNESKRGNSLTVNLFFKDRVAKKEEGKWIKEINTSKDSEEVEIEGLSRTYSDTQSGIYKGNFTVRVVY